jgi:hypothetical protein
VGHFEQDACRKALGVPDDAQIIELLALGYPGADVKLPTAKTRAQSRKPLGELVCWETYTA